MSLYEVLTRLTNHPCHERGVLALRDVLDGIEAIFHAHGLSCECRMCENLLGMRWALESLTSLLDSELCHNPAFDQLREQHKQAWQVPPACPEEILLLRMCDFLETGQELLDEEDAQCPSDVWWDFKEASWMVNLFRELLESIVGMSPRLLQRSEQIDQLMNGADRDDDDDDDDSDEPDEPAEAVVADNPFYAPRKAS